MNGLKTQFPKREENTDFELNVDQQQRMQHLHHQQPSNN